MSKRNNTGYYITYPTHYELLDENGNHVRNVTSWDELVNYGKSRGVFFRGEWRTSVNK